MCNFPRSFERGTFACFEGEWSRLDRIVIEQTLEVVERRLNLPHVSDDLGPPWTCQHYPRVRHQHLYVASRFRLTEVFTVRSVLDLRMQLLERASALVTFSSNGAEAGSGSHPAPTHPPARS